MTLMHLALQPRVVAVARRQWLTADENGRTPSTVACSVAQRLSRSSLCTGSQDEDAIARAASLERAEPAPGSQMLDDGDDDDDDDEYED